MVYFHIPPPPMVMVMLTLFYRDHSLILIMIANFEKIKIHQVSYSGFLLGIFSGGKIYCYANFYCYSIVFRPNFREGQKFSGGQTASGGHPPVPPVEESQYIFRKSHQISKR